MYIEKNKNLPAQSLSISLTSFIRTQAMDITGFRNDFNPKQIIPLFKEACENKNIVSVFLSASRFLILNLVYWFIPGWFLFGIYQIIFSKKLWQIAGTKIEIALYEHQLAVRLSIKYQPMNIATLASILPFVVGFSQFLTQKYQTQLNHVFFQKNVPALGLPTEKLHWDTVQYLLKDQSNFLHAIDQVHWAENYVFITKKAKLQPVTFIANLKINKIDSMQKSGAFLHELESAITGPFNNTLGGSESRTIELIPLVSQKEVPSVTTFYNKLDELPFKLESFFLKTPLKENSNDFLFSFPTPVNPGKSVLIQNTKGYLGKNKLLPDKNLVFKTDKKGLMGLNKIHKVTPNNQVSLDKLDKNYLKNLFISNKITFFQDIELFQNELKNLFLKKGLNPSLEFVSLEKSKLAFDLIKKLYSNLKTVDENLFFEELISDIDGLFLGQEYLPARRMSGYQYPDMTTKEVSWFFLQKKFWSFKELGLKIQLPPSFAIAKTYRLMKMEIPDFLIESKPMLLKDQEKDEILYQGLGLILNSSKGLDWETQTLMNPAEQNTAQNEKSLRDWLQIYLSPYNPLNYFKENFFGIYQSAEFKKQSLKNLNDSSWLSNLPLYRNGVLINLEPSFISFQTNVQVPFISENEWNENYQRIKKELILKGDVLENNSKEITFPIIETRKPTNKDSNLSLGVLGPLDYEFSSPLVVEKEYEQNSIFTNLNFFPSNSNILEEENFGNMLASGIYQKFESLFSKGNNLVFHDIWEPLTVRSWLIISQIGFAFLVFRILKALADNYGRELLVYLLDLVAALGILDDDLKQEIEILMGQREKGFRIITKTTKNFNNVAGIKTLLPEIAEIVWFLRNSAREFSLSKTLPRGVLLTGPPGTGKTLLVQALAGEAQVPVLALSGSSLVEPGESGALKLEILFQEARRLAPCIVFIDEIDTLAQKRDQVMQNPMGADEVLESLNTANIATNTTNQIPKVNSELNLEKFEGNSESQTEKSEELRAQQEIRQEQLSLLMQFLVELDGIQGRDGVIVIGATNRPEMLDSAVLRPGRFDRVLELGLPGHQKRLEILKLYGQRLGYNNSLSWEYLAQRTAGFTAADLASIMNESSLKAILGHTQHTLETIEHGIDRITTSETLKPKVFSFNDIATTRLAYYQAGKIVLSTLLEYHPSVLVAHLWPRRTNIRSLQISSNVQKYFFQFARRCELEHRVLGCYGGKAAEILFLEQTPSNVSNLGVDDLSFAQILITFIIDKWYLYSKNTSMKKGTEIADNRNNQEFPSDQMEFLQELAQNIELAPSNLKGNLGEIPSSQRSQSYFSTAWWQHQVSNELEFVEGNFADWYRLYLPNPEETEINPEWSPPDEFYHRNKMLEEVTGSITWNELYNISRDYQIHSLVLQGFNKALSILDEHRELLDRVSYELLHHEILREADIQNIFKSFGFEKEIIKDIPICNNKTTVISEPKTINNNKIQVLEKPWGFHSRKKNFKWIDFEKLSNEIV